jgi:hypothetical protein
MLEKIAKLLAQAEGTNNPAEAQAFTDKAFALAQAYNIDIAMAKARQKDRGKNEEVETRAIKVGEPGRKFKNMPWVDLFLAIARNNDVRCTIAHDRATVYAYGFPSDIDMCERLFASLNVQMVGQCNTALRDGVHKAQGVHGATFRPNFYVGFGNEISRRLHEARKNELERRAQEEKAEQERFAEMIAAAAPSTGFVEDAGTQAELDSPQEESLSTELVLKAKVEQVDEFYRSKTGHLRGGYGGYSPNRSSYSAQGVGREAARKVSIGGAGSLPGARKAIR